MDQTATHTSSSALVVSIDESEPGARPTYDELAALERSSTIIDFDPTALPYDDPRDPELFGHLAG